MTETTSRNPPPHSPRRTQRRTWPPLAGAATVAMTVGACSTWSLTGSTPSTPPAPSADTAAAPADGSFTSRVKSLFSGNSASLRSSADVNCPHIEYRQGAATWAVNGPAAENSAMSLRYQASFTQTARECLVSDSTLTIKVGVQGRIVLGPAGSAGVINVPLRYALVRDDLHPRTLWTKLFTIPVTVPADELNVTWLHVQEEMTVPRPSPQELDAYVIYVGFDPTGAAKPAARPKTARAK